MLTGQLGGGEDGQRIVEKIKSSEETRGLFYYIEKGLMLVFLFWPRW
jgi:hypothetical protein